uniref:Uncharacterized protein n=1 Tax=Anguilla anguilla TaxID=7936 RepID=A0A0E9TP54_ANGAN
MHAVACPNNTCSLGVTNGQMVTTVSHRLVTDGAKLLPGFIFTPTAHI